MKKALTIFTAVLLIASIFVGCTSSDGAKSSGLQNAKNYLYAMYKDKAVATASDYTVVDTVMINGVSYPVTWSADTDEGNVAFVDNGNHKVTVDVNEKTPVAVEYNLTATLTDPQSGAKASVSFPHSIPAFKESSWVEYEAAAKGDTVVVKGVVTGIMSKTKGNSSNCLYLQDEVGGYYIYALALDPVESGIELGMTVRVTGSKDVYSGTLEIANGSVEILDEGKTAYAPVDWTAKFDAATSLKDASLVREQALLVTVKNVEITGQDTASGYYKFKKNGLESYIRISSSVCPIDKDAQTALKNGHADHYGWTADVTGVICVFDGAFYLSPVDGFDAFTYVSLPSRSDSDMVAFELDSITVAEAVTEDTTIALPTSGAGYTQVSISWTSDSECAVVDGGALTVTLPEEDTIVTLTATVSSGDVKVEKEFKVAVDGASALAGYPLPVSEYAEHVPYYFGTVQANIGKNLFFDGGTSGGKYLTTSDKAAKASVIYLEAAEGGWRIYTLADGAKMYVEIVDGKAALNAEPQGNVWRIEETTNVPVTLVGDTEYYLGMYKTYNTFSASKTSYILSDTSVIGVSQFPGIIAKLGYVEDTYVALESVEETSVLLWTDQANLGKTLYADGALSGGKYLSTVEKAEKAGVIALVKEGDGFRLKGENGFVEIVDGKAAVNAEPAGSLWTLKGSYSIPVTMVGDTEYYLGMYKTYNTFSASKTSYIEDESVIGVSQFPMRLAYAESQKKVSALVRGYADGIDTYYLGVEQNNAGKVLFATGEVTGGKYLASNSSFEKAMAVTLVKEGDGFRMVTADGLFVEIVGGKAAVNAEAQGSVWTIDENSGVPATECDGTMYYLGCYKTYETFSASKTSYIEDTSLIGVSQFPMGLYAVVEAEI